MEKIKDMPEQERPREKAMKYGIDTLSSRELVAVILRCGNRRQSALELASVLIRDAGGLRGLAQKSFEDLSVIPGISRLNALQIKAALELGRRVAYEEIQRTDVVKSPTDMHLWLKQHLGFKNQEEFMVIYLDRAHCIIHSEVLFRGTADKAVVSPADVFRRSLLLNAACIMLVHNHPGGSLSPSREDITLTERMISCGKMMNIEVLDHLIVSSSGVFSMRENGFAFRNT